MYKYILQALLFICCHHFTLAQTLNIPPRKPTDKNGSQIINYISDMSADERDTYLLNEIVRGNIPNFYRTMVRITDSTIIEGVYKHIVYYVTPDYLALGSNSDYFLCPMSPILGQKVADSLNCTLPTRKMVNQIWNAASVKMQPEPILPSPEMTTVPVFAIHNSMVWIQRQIFLPENPLGNLVSGDKKDVVISNLINSSSPPKRVVIYGWHYPSGKNIQPLYAGHIYTYADYSHGIRLIQNQVYVDGDTLLVKDVLHSTKLHSLLSDEGVILSPFYPVK